MLAPETPGNAPGEPELLQELPDTSPGERHQCYHLRRLVPEFSQPRGFPQRSGVHRWVRLVLLRGWAQKIPKSNGWIQRKVPKTTAEPHIATRSHEKDPVGELLSEHCFAGKCSTSHVLDPGDAWERLW